MEVALCDQSFDILIAELDGFLIGHGAECGMIDPTASVEDGNGVALAGIAKLPSVDSAEHAGGTVQCRALPLLGNERMHALKRFDLLNKAIFAFEGETIELEGIVVGNIDFNAELGADDRGRLLLGSNELIAVAAPVPAVLDYIHSGSLGKLNDDCHNFGGIDALNCLNIRSPEGSSISDRGGAAVSSSAVYSYILIHAGSDFADVFGEGELTGCLCHCAAECGKHRHESEKAGKNASESSFHSFPTKSLLAVLTLL